MPTEGRPDAPHSREAQPRRAGPRARWYLEPEMLVALGALAASLCAVAVGAYEAYLQRRYDRASVWPRVEVTFTSGASGARVELVNGGLGPAIVEYVAVRVDGRPARDWADVLTRVMDHPPKLYATSTARDRAIRAGDSAVLLAISPGELAGLTPAAAQRVTMEVCFSSVYEQHWLLLTRGTRTYREVARCAPPPGESLF